MKNLPCKYEYNFKLVKFFSSYLKQLYTNYSKQELEQECDNHNVSDGLDGDNQTLHNLFETLSPVDGSQRPKHTEHTKNLEETDATASKDGDQRHGHNHNIENVEWRSSESTLMEQEAISDQLQTALDGEDGGKHVVKVSKCLKMLGFDSKFLITMILNSPG